MMMMKWLRLRLQQWLTKWLDAESAAEQAQRREKARVPRRTTPLVFFSTGLADVDRVLGGGLAEGSATLLFGDPGVGKTTLLLQIMRLLLARGVGVLFVSGEQSKRDLRSLWARLSSDPLPEECISDDNEIGAAVDLCVDLKAKVLVVDSLLSTYFADVSADEGSTAQMKAIANYLTSFAKETGTTVLLVGHTTKDGFLGTPEVVAHLVDTVALLDRDVVEGDDGEVSYNGERRTLTIPDKHRYGATGLPSAYFTMTPTGLVSAAPTPRTVLGADPSA